jgi:2-polyprenyl-6-methoxyphenol hydroxylase-like FAD-dependent oxidoreductase
MNSGPETYQVAIVGAGPVGLFLGICLEEAGISTIILEKRIKPRSGSRSLGIHPVSLELFQQLGFADVFTKAGIKICNGHAFANTTKLGTISFGDCPKPFNYILALPQYKTERILEEKITNINPHILVRGAEVTGISKAKEYVEIEYQSEGQLQSIKCSYLIGCDGKDSFVRDQANISFEGDTYPDTYIMGDFTDNTEFGSDAAIFLCDDGLIESFPLLNGRRRWVVKTKEYFSSVDRNDIEYRIKARINHDLGGTENVMLSSFGVQKLVAQPMVKHRIILAGDAAHVVSPIGGQGMNLGWLGVWDLAQSLNQILAKGEKANNILKKFGKRRQKAARNAIRRGEMNMRLGRQSNFPAFRNSIVWLMINSPLSQLMAKLFTMRGVERWII